MKESKNASAQNTDSVDMMILEKLESLEKRMSSLEENVANIKTDILNGVTDGSETDGEGVEVEEEQIDPNSQIGITLNILDNFDFDRCAKVMEFLEWRWANDETETPNSENILQLAKRLFRDAWSDLEEQPFNEEGYREWFVGTGGLEVWVCETDEKNLAPNERRYLASLKFIVEEWREE